MDKNTQKWDAIASKKARIRKTLEGNSERPRLSVYRSEAHIYGQIIDDISGKTLFSASTVAKDLRDQVKELKPIDAAKAVGEALAEKAVKGGLTKVVFDRNGRRYGGRLQAFADGVNAYRATMTPASTPIEYKLLGTTPMAHWEPRYSVYLLMRMALTLAYNPDDLRRTRVAALVGRDAANALFPRNAPIQEPIQPVPGRTAPREEWVAIPAPGAPDTSLLAPASAASMLEHTALAMPGAEQTGDALGSNNWAIAPTRTASGGALLSGDPHLDLSLPSIWYEAHLVVKDSLDVYGVTFPGSPTIVIGFNKDVAWTFTLYLFATVVSIPIMTKLSDVVGRRLPRGGRQPDITNEIPSRRCMAAARATHRDLPQPGRPAGRRGHGLLHAPRADDQ